MMSRTHVVLLVLACPAWTWSTAPGQANEPAPEALEVFTDVTRVYSFHIIAHYQILLCLENLVRNEEALRRLEQIHHLVATVEISAEMLRKYGDMVPGLVERLRLFDTGSYEVLNKKQDESS